jgi:hypothetical protein
MTWILFSIQCNEKKKKESKKEKSDKLSLRLFNGKMHPKVEQTYIKDFRNNVNVASLSTNQIRKEKMNDHKFLMK